jgi:hypothetical protein
VNYNVENKHSNQARRNTEREDGEDVHARSNFLRLYLQEVKENGTGKTNPK